MATCAGHSAMQLKGQPRRQQCRVTSCLSLPPLLKTETARRCTPRVLVLPKGAILLVVAMSGGVVTEGAERPRNWSRSLDTYLRSEGAKKSPTLGGEQGGKAGNKKSLKRHSATGTDHVFTMSAWRRLTGSTNLTGGGPVGSEGGRARASRATVCPAGMPMSLSSSSGTRRRTYPRALQTMFVEAY